MYLIRRQCIWLVRDAPMNIQMVVYILDNNNYLITIICNILKQKTNSTLNYHICITY